MVLPSTGFGCSPYRNAREIADLSDTFGKAKRAGYRLFVSAKCYAGVERKVFPIPYPAEAPKSIAAYRAEKAARRLIRVHPTNPVPISIRSAPTRLMEESGRSRDQICASETEEATGGMPLLPDSIEGKRFCRPSDAGFEMRLLEQLRKTDGWRHRARERWQREKNRDSEGPNR